VITLFHFALNEGGYLFMGPSETIGRQIDLFEPLSKKWRTYRRIGPTRPERVDFPVVAKTEVKGKAHRPAEPVGIQGINFAEVTQRLLLEQFAPAAVLINRKYEIFYYFGRCAKYLELPTGHPVHDLSLMAREGLRTKLRGAVHRAIRDNQSVVLTDIQVKRNGSYYPVRATVRPVQAPKAAEGLLLITFEDEPGSATPTSTVGAQKHTEAADESAIRQLEYELKATREDLQSTIEELESSNEELKASNEEVMSMNEELQSANEELETSKEELQSLNEELSTVNNQLQDKVEELEKANNDMSNLLNCTDIATVFLDVSFRIKLFTPATTKLFNLIASDVGRSVGDITARFEDQEMLADAQLVLRLLVPREKEITTGEGTWWARRIMPYRTRDNRIDGVVITFVDITERKKAADVVVRRLAAIVESSADAVFSKDLDGTIRTWNRGAERLYGYTADESIGHSVEMLIPGDRGKDFATIMTQVRRGENIEQMETERLCKDGQRLPVELTISPVRDGSGKVVSGSVISRDISERKRAETALRESEKRLAAELAGMSRLQEVSTRLVQAGDSTSLLLEIIDAAIALTAADMGNIQLFDRDAKVLKIVANRGFEKPFLEYFNVVQHSQAACGTALQMGKRVVIDDITTSPVFAGSPALDILLAAGVRAVESTPLVGRSGRVVGMLSTHYRTPRRLADRDLHVLDMLARQAADWIERTLAEQAMRESEERFRLTADAAPVLIWMSGTDKLCTWFNQPWLAFTGRPMERELGNGWTENVHAEDYDRCLKTYTTAFDSRQAFSMEYRLKRHDGEYRWLLDNGVPLYGADRAFAGYIGSCVDITERREAEESVAAAYRHLKLAMTAGRMAAWTWDPEKDVVLRTENFPEIYGVSNVNGLDQGMALVHPDDRNRHMETVENAVDQGTAYHSVFRIIRPDNEQAVWLDERAVPVTDSDGHFMALSGVVVDVTERKQAEQDLLASEERLRAILDTAMDAIITIDEQGIIRSVNATTERMFGYTAAEMIGQNVKLLMPSPHQEEHDNYIARFLQTGEKHILGINREVDARRKDGSVFPTELAVSEIKHLKLFTGIHRDLTERKQLERDVVEVASLEQRRIGQDLHDSVAQELTALNLLAKDLPETLAGDPAKASQLVEQMAQGLQRSQIELRAVMRGLLPVPVDSEGLMAALADLADRIQQEGKVACTFDCPEPVSVADNLTATHVFLIAQEAVHNAVKHAQAQKIRINLTAADGDLVLNVQDDGVGMPARFTATQGLGLRIMRNRAAIIGATLTLNPAEPTGTVVTCVLARKNHERTKVQEANAHPDRR
jgi:PAS domain S-box-containing protein